MTRSGTMAATGTTEAPLIQQARRGNMTAWDALVRQHQKPAFRLAYLLLGDAADAEEVTQDAFVRAYQALNTFDETRPFRPWLLQITRNLAKNRLRSLSRYWQMVKRYWQLQAPAVATVADTSDAEQGDESRLLWQAVRQLPAKGQEIIYFRYFLEMSEAEMAAALNIPPGTVKSRLHRALQQLRSVIEADFTELKDEIE